MAVILVVAQSLALAEQEESPMINKDRSMQEWNAYYHPAPDEDCYKGAKLEYMQKLSPGGRIFFLTNRKDFAEALAALEKFPKKGTGSALYVKAVCLDGLKKHSEAVKCFADAESKIDLVFHPGPKFFLQYATALFHAKQYSRSSTYLDIAEKMSLRPIGKDNKQHLNLSKNVRERKAGILEAQTPRANTSAVSPRIRDFGKYFSSISMFDVPQLVSQKDVDLHNVYMEGTLDAVDYLHNPKPGAKIPPFDTRMLIAARKQMAQKRYGDCYSTLDKFIAANLADGDMPTEYWTRGNKFADQYLHKVRMLQLGAGYAAGRPNMGLSLRGNFDPGDSDFWRCVENRLLGRDALVSKNDPPHVKKNSDLVPWCHFAIAVRSMSKKDFKTAASEFAEVNAKGTRDEDLVVHASSLKDYCEKRR